MTSVRLRTALWMLVCVTLADNPNSARSAAPDGTLPRDRTSADLAEAQRHFYSARYAEAAAMALALRQSDTSNLAAYELRASALHFQIRRALGDSTNKDRALRQCAACAGLLEAFKDETARGQAVARARLKKDESDENALFFLGKLDLNHVWLHLGTLGRRTGWGEYWEARHSLDAVLKRNPNHVRARIARAWIDYIVDTKVPFGLRWVLGGGNKKRALETVRAAANADGDFFVNTEAGFSLWEMQIRERDQAGALETARRLVRDFPDNQELVKFVRGSAP